MSHDTGEAVDWRALAAAISPCSPRLSAAGDLAYVATDDPTIGGRVRIVRLADGAAGAVEPGPADSGTEHTEHTPRWSPGGRQLAFVAAGPDVDEVRVVAPDGSTCTTIPTGEGWRVDDLQWISARFGSNNPAFYDILLGGPPSDGTLILHGDGDRCTPVGQADELFRALLDHHVPTELVVYPGEGHGLRSRSAQLDAWARTIAWFDRHVKHETGC
jgi:dipeptidyl aminopeptidase/acylaminoacyl peptidase